MARRSKIAAGIVVLLGVVVAVTAWPKTRTQCAGFLPENNLSILENDANAGGITQAQFNEVLDKIGGIYSPIIAAKGAKLIINRRWTDGTVNASAYQQGSNWYLNMYGGLARHPAVTVEGFSLVVCHELGHHVGGFPKYGGYQWATNEGGSDYFATLKCLRHVHGAGEQADPLDPLAEQACKATFSDAGARNQCGKGTMAGVSVANLFQALSPAPKPPRLDTPDPTQVAKTTDGHPAGQCRLDTYFQGALCAKPLAENVSDSDPIAGACTASQGFTIGLRPRCWYKPAEGQGLTIANVAGGLPLPESKKLQLKLDAMGASLSGGGL